LISGRRLPPCCGTGARAGLRTRTRPAEQEGYEAAVMLDPLEGGDQKPARQRIRSDKEPAAL
jgi:hypothetical protein